MSNDTRQETRGTTCYGHWDLSSASGDIIPETRDYIFCYGHWVLSLVISHTRQGVRFVTGIGFCLLGYHIRNREYDVLWALGSASCDSAHGTGGTICFGHWIPRLLISHTRQEVRFAPGIGVCVL